MDYSIAEAELKFVLSSLLIFALSSCGGVMVSRSDVVGDFCGNSEAEYGGIRRHILKLSDDGKYRYLVSELEAGAINSVNGQYFIYGQEPVERIELAGVCFSSGRNCEDYPAQVMSRGENLYIVLEDEQGTPVALQKGDCPR